MRQRAAPAAGCTDPIKVYKVKIRFGDARLERAVEPLISLVSEHTRRIHSDKCLLRLLSYGPGPCTCAGAGRGREGPLFVLISG
ncbi:hypothetical protein EVAR_48250_1 [Eumeta japonica]|uniref:Uncharacterized protein n=1 Tax=Eumeta variegata TaxID=151549 RepID=A0A4C1YGM4_EUMVA|nr:hypothetical protein EVAR_48250_1 [Eumeta japonica]